MKQLPFAVSKLWEQDAVTTDADLTCFFRNKKLQTEYYRVNAPNDPFLVVVNCILLQRHCSYAARGAREHVRL